MAAGVAVSTGPRGWHPTHSQRLALGQQGNSAITGFPRQPNAFREILLRLLLLRHIATRRGVSVKKFGVKPLDCVFVRGLDELLIRIHGTPFYCLPRRAALRPIPTADLLSAANEVERGHLEMLFQPLRGNTCGKPALIASTL